MNLFIVGPWLATIDAIYKFSTSISWLFSAFALADFTTLAIIEAAPLGVNFNIANASSTFFPLIKSATIFTFLAEILAYFNVASAFIIGAFIGEGVNPLVMYPVFMLAGIGWATINVNSFPMVVELAKGGDVGKYTGYYYTASMSAQIVTPMLSGFFMDMDGIGMTILFPYAAVFAALAFVTMSMVKHGDNRPEKKKTVLENFDVED